MKKSGAWLARYALGQLGIPYRYQLHQMDLHAFMKGITKATWHVTARRDIVPTLYAAHELATRGDPGPVFIELPANLLMFTEEVGELPRPAPPPPPPAADPAAIDAAAALLAQARRPGLFVGWGARDALADVTAIAEHLQAPVATTLQGFSVFPAAHPLHTGFSVGPHAVPASRNAFADCDALLAVGTRFAEIATGSCGMPVPADLVHIDINPAVLGANHPPRVGIAADKAAYRQTWYDHAARPEAQGRVNPARFFDALRAANPPEAVTVVDDGNHTYLTAELFPILSARSAIVPTDFNAMGYSVPAAIGARHLRIASDADLAEQIAAANAAAVAGQPVIVDVAIDYSRRTAFTEGVVKTNFQRFTLGQKARALSRALLRRVTG